MTTHRQTLLYTLIVALGGFVFGFDASVISGTVSFVTEQFALDAWQQGMVVSSPTLGALVGMLLAGPLADKFGRRDLLIAVAALYVVSALFSALATGFTMLMVARFIGGIAFCSLMVAPMYIAEISQPEHRGKLVSINQFNIVLGLSAAYFTNYGLLQLSQSSAAWVADWQLSSAVWRYMLGLELVPALLWFGLLFTLPKSPRWLLMQGLHSEAKGVLGRLGFANIEATCANMQASFAEQQLSLAAQAKTLFSPLLRRALLIGVVVGLTQQLTGINVIFFYAPTIFAETGMGTDASFVQAIWVGVTNVLFTLVAMWGVDKFGRRPLLLVGLVGIVLSLSLCAIGFQDAEQPQGTLVLIGILGFVASFAMSLGPVMWVLFAEIFPNHVRGLAISLVTVVNSLASFATQLFFPWELEHVGAQFTFLTYAAFGLLGLIFIYRLLPETKGKSLEQIQALWR